MTTGFDRVARAYRWLECAAFGRLLERARFAHVDRLAKCHDILLIGDGDGRFLERLVRVAPRAAIRSIDASAVMLQLASARLAAADRARVAFEHGDVMAVALPDARYDAVVTLFVLDCFSDAEVGALAARLAGAATADAAWLFADFAIPERGAVRPIAAAVVSALYWFFRMTTALGARRLPASDAAIRRVGFARERSAVFAAGLIDSAVYVRPSRTAGSIESRMIPGG